MHYIHRLHPEIIQFTDQIALRWYGLAYLGGVLAGYILLRRLIRCNLLHITEEQLQDFLTTLFLVGIFIGGRLGYFLFYAPETFWQDPIQLIQVWHGGMASHGGIIGCLLVMIWSAKRYKVSFWNLADNVCVVGTLGLFFGRMANFINGELWGRPSQVPWAVVFPDVLGTRLPPEMRYDLPQLQRLVETGILQARHPSQLYEAFGEGLLLFAVLWFLRHQKWSQVRQGRLGIVFLVGYGFSRFVCEFFREPDSTVYFGWMSKGQLLTLGMFAAAGVVAALPRPGFPNDPKA